MAVVNSAVLIEQFRLAFVIYCDEQNLSVQQGERLADEIGQDLEFTAIDRDAWDEDGGA